MSQQNYRSNYRSNTYRVCGSKFTISTFCHTSSPLSIDGHFIWGSFQFGVIRIYENHNSEEEHQPFSKDGFFKDHNWNKFTNDCREMNLARWTTSYIVFGGEDCGRGVEWFVYEACLRFVNSNNKPDKCGRCYNNYCSRGVKMQLGRIKFEILHFYNNWFLNTWSPGVQIPLFSEHSRSFN